jgi:hypothetical protein
MDISELVKDASAEWDRQSPASRENIAALTAQVGLELPTDYLVFLQNSNGGEGCLAVDPGWFQIWPAEKVAEWNQNYRVAEFIPGFLGFGSNGGGELFAFDMRGNKPWPIVMIPFDWMEPAQAQPVADNFNEFVKKLGREGDHAGDQNESS